MIFFLFIINLFAISATNLAKFSANALYNLDNTQLAVNLLPFIKSDKTIVAVKVINGIDNSIFFQIYKKNNRFIESNIPKNILMFQSDEANVTYNNEIIGKLIIYRKIDILTPVKEEWIKTHVVKTGVFYWKPVIFSNNGHDIDGIVGDFVKLIVKKTGLKLQIVNKQ